MNGLNAGGDKKGGGSDSVAAAATPAMFVLIIKLRPHN
jgi:hypothetical protein